MIWDHMTFIWRRRSVLGPQLIRQSSIPHHGNDTHNWLSTVKRFGILLAYISKVYACLLFILFIHGTNLHQKWPMVMINGNRYIHFGHCGQLVVAANPKIYIWYTIYIYIYIMIASSACAVNIATSHWGNRFVIIISHPPSLEWWNPNVNILSKYNFSGPLFTRKTPSHGSRYPQYKPKTVLQPSRGFNWNPYKNKTPSS